MKRYEHANYSLGVTTRETDCIETRPNWFARVILRRKPKRVSVEDVARKLRAARKQVEDEMMRDIFGNGKR